MNQESTSGERRVVPAVLTIAGSDSGGGAGIQADLHTFLSLGVFGTSAITCLTAQSPKGVYGIFPADVEMVCQQIRAVCEAFPVEIAKTGMLFSAEIIRAVAAADVRQGIEVLVVDPVMVSASGAQLLEEDAVDALCDDLLPQARLITPNIGEAELLLGQPIRDVAAMKAAARDIGDRFDTACVIKGAHLDTDEVVDFLYDEGVEYSFTAPRVMGVETHGAGCAFSAAITAFLARGELIQDAVAKAKKYVHRALLLACRVGPHTPLNFVDAGIHSSCASA